MAFQKITTTTEREKEKIGANIRFSCNICGFDEIDRNCLSENDYFPKIIIFRLRKMKIGQKFFEIIALVRFIGLLLLGLSFLFLVYVRPSDFVRSLL